MKPDAPLRGHPWWGDGFLGAVSKVTGLSACPPVPLSSCPPVFLPSCPPVPLSSYRPVRLQFVHTFVDPFGNAE